MTEFTLAPEECDVDRVVDDLGATLDLLWTPHMRLKLQTSGAARQAIIASCEAMAHNMKAMDRAVKEAERLAAQGQMKFEEGC